VSGACEHVGKIGDHLRRSCALRIDPVHRAEVGVGGVVVDHGQGDVSVLFRLVDIAHAVGAGRVQADDQVVGGVDAARGEDLPRAGQVAKFSDERVVHGRRGLFAQVAQQPDHAQQAAVGVAVGADVADAEHALALVEQGEQFGRNGCVHDVQ
jgi:hypothetical protein